MTFHNQKLVFIFSDPGGAKQILSIAQENLKNNEIILFSDRSYDFFSDFDLHVVQLRNSQIQDIISEVKPNYVITGTSYTSPLEVLTIRHCIDFNIPVYSLVDNWSNFKRRFSHENNLIYPDKIYVLDEISKSNALKEGITEEKLEVMPHNPYLTFLSNWTPSISRMEVCSMYQLDEQKKILYYVPDPLSNVGGVQKYGFDEYSSTKEIYQKFHDVNFVFKLHPNQNLDIINQFDHFDIIYITENKYHNHFLHFSDMVIGFFSNALVEAKVLGSMPLRYIKGLKIEDPFEDNSIPILKI